MITKRIRLFLCALLAVSLSFACIAAVSAAEGGEWQAYNSAPDITVTPAGVSIVTGTPNTATTIRYSQKHNFNDGGWLEFIVPYATSIDMDANARKGGTNYIKTTVVNDSGIGFEIVVYALYSRNATTFTNKMQADIYYLDPALARKAGDIYTDTGKRYLETFNTFVRVEDIKHIVDLHRENDMWFIAFDGLTAMPVKEYNEVDLSQATVTFEYFTKQAIPEFRIYPLQSGIHKNYIENGFMQFGSDEIKQNNDDTVTYKVRDGLASMYPGQEIRYREQLISSVGYDVRKPINIEYSYDVSNASAVWYALGLGRGNVIDTVTRLKYDVFGFKAGGDAQPGDDVLVTSGYSDNIASKNDGIMFQTTTGMAQPTVREQNHRLETYTTNSASKPYSGRGNMDLVTFIVGETGTSMYHNGKLIFDGLVTKLSDFAGSGYLAYPYFHFFEDSANLSKGNTIVIKGVNSPLRTDDNALRVVGDSGNDLTVGLDNMDNGDITLHNYVSGVLEAVPADLYSYDAAQKIITVKHGYFSGKAYTMYKLYARSNSGSEEIEVRYSDPALATQPPSTEHDNYDWPEKAGTENLVIKVDIKNGIWKSFSGGGILAANFSYVPGGGTSVGQVIINKEFLNNKKAGIFTFTVRTENVEQEEFLHTFTITIKGEGEEPTSTDKPGETQDNGGTNALVYILIGAGVIALAVITVIILRKKANKK